MTSERNKEIIEKAVEIGFANSVNQVTGTQLKLRKFDARKLCELTVIAMEYSIPEVRHDDKPNPKVGAAIYFPDGSVEFAYRGELREGNHGEFTLLERKLVGRNVEEGILFTTLEPCLKRNKPKKGCSRHIVGARIKKVYVGIEDDNPEVKGKGIEYMVRHGVTYEMYDQDLQQQILATNQEFFDWARQQEDEPKEEEPIKLSEYENSLPAVDQTDLSKKALDLYREKADISASGADFDRLLQKQRVLVEEDDKIVPSGFGLLLFGDDPSSSMNQARLLARAELASGKESRKEFNSALVLLPDELEEWLNTVLPDTVDRSTMERRQGVDLPFEMIREAVVNALVHRDYDIDDQQCQLVIDKDTITIKSPGGPIPPITLEQMQSFSAPIKSRNPLVHHVFARMRFAEQQGFGLSSLKKQAEELGLPLPRIAWEDPYLVLTIYRSSEGAVTSLDEEVLSKLNKAQREGWEWLSKRGSATRIEYEKARKVSERTANRHLARFEELGLVKPDGSGPSTSYEVVR